MSVDIMASLLIAETIKFDPHEKNILFIKF